MSIFSLPGWIKPHLYPGKKFDDLTAGEINELKERISHFKDEQPDVSVVIPAWNEADNIYRTLSSLASGDTKYKVEIVVINNNSTDRTQQVLDTLGVRSYMQPVQGTPHARQMGLDKARGKYHLCADSDTMYPPKWIDLMVAPMVKDKNITGVYGRYSFIPPEGDSRLGLVFYESIVSLLVQIRKRKKEFMNVFGFNMGFVTEIGRETGGFKVAGNRVYNNVSGSDYVNEAEDGRMALNLKTRGNLQMVTDPKARVFTSPRRLLDDGGIWNAFKNRARMQLKGMGSYFGKS